METISNSTLWEEKNSIKQEKNCLKNNVVEQKSITNEIKNDLTKKVWNDTGKISGIYKIVNKINGKYYVGSSKNINWKRGRWKRHIHTLIQNTHHNIHLQNAWNKYGKDNFNFIIVEEVPDEQLLSVEQKYLDISNKEKHKCYNMNFLAGRIEMTPEVCQKISDANKKRVWTLKTRKLISCNNTKQKHPLWGKKFSKKKCNIKENNPMFDNTIYEFIKNDQLFVGYRCDFIQTFVNKKSAEAAVSAILSRKKESHLGWKLRG